MNILEIRTLRGPNYWSGYWKKLIIMRLDIGDYEEKPSDKIKGFYQRMNELMPSLLAHGCSYGEEGGFLRRVEEGTWAGHIIEHFALEMQTLAGMDVGYGQNPRNGRTREFITSCSVIVKKKSGGMLPSASQFRIFEDLAEGQAD